MQLSLKRPLARLRPRGPSALDDAERTVASTRAASAAPETIGPYRLQEQLGQGGMGRIYRALDADGRVVALKVIRPEHASDPTFRRRFAREARAALAVNHPHVVRVLDSGEHEGVPYLATAYVEGARSTPGSPAAGRSTWRPPSGCACMSRAGSPHCIARGSSTVTSSRRTSSWTRRDPRS